MQIVGVHHVPSLTRARYEQVVQSLTGGKTRFDDPAQLPDGLVVHLAWEADDGFWIIDLFDSEEAFDRFGEAVRPIAQAAGITEPVEGHVAHTALWR